jgi:hypothetical protein
VRFVLCIAGKDLISIPKHVLHPRWGLDNHPLTKKALELLNLGSGKIDPIHNSPESVAPQAAETANRSGCIDLEIYQGIGCPTTQQRRYQKLDEIFKQIVEKGANSNDHVFRTAMIRGSALLNELKDAFNHRTPNPEMTSSALQPPQRRLKSLGLQRMSGKIHPP